jgi:hypothetical protein
MTFSVNSVRVSGGIYQFVWFLFKSPTLLKVFVKKKTFRFKVDTCRW